MGQILSFLQEPLYGAQTAATGMPALAALAERIGLRNDPNLRALVENQIGAYNARHGVSPTGQFNAGSMLGDPASGYGGAFGADPSGNPLSPAGAYVQYATGAMGGLGGQQNAYQDALSRLASSAGVEGPAVFGAPSVPAFNPGAVQGVDQSMRHRPAALPGLEPTGRQQLLGGREERVAPDLLPRLRDWLGGLVGSFQSGTPYVPATGLAMVHEGEAVVPRQRNPWAQMASKGGGMPGGYAGATPMGGGGAAIDWRAVRNARGGSSRGMIPSLGEKPKQPSFGRGSGHKPIWDAIPAQGEGGSALGPNVGRQSAESQARPGAVDMTRKIPSGGQYSNTGFGGGDWGALMEQRNNPWSAPGGDYQELTPGLSNDVQTQMLNRIRDQLATETQGIQRGIRERAAAGGSLAGGDTQRRLFEAELARLGAGSEAARDIGIASAERDFADRLAANQFELQRQMGLGGLGLEARGQDIERLLGLGGLGVQRELGLGGLGVEHRGLDIQQLLGERGLDLEQFGLETQRQLGQRGLDIEELLGMEGLDIERLLAEGNLGLQERELEFGMGRTLNQDALAYQQWLADYQRQLMEGLLGLGLQTGELEQGYDQGLGGLLSQFA